MPDGPEGRRFCPAARNRFAGTHWPLRRDRRRAGTRRGRHPPEPGRTGASSDRERAGRGRPAETRSRTGRHPAACPGGELPAWPAHRRAGDHAAAASRELAARTGQSRRAPRASPPRSVGASQVGLLLNGLAEARLGLVEPAQRAGAMSPRLVSATRNRGCSLQPPGSTSGGSCELARIQQHLAEVIWASAETGSSCTALREMFNRRKPCLPEAGGALARLL